MISVNPGSVLHCVHVLNTQMDLFPTLYDSPSLDVARGAFDKLSQLKLTCPVEKVAVKALLFRISQIREPPASRFFHEKVIYVASHFFGDECGLASFEASLSQEVFPKAWVLDQVLSRHIYPNRESLLFVARDLIKEGMTEDSVSCILKEIAKIPFEKREDFCRSVEPLLKEGLSRNTLHAILTGVQEVPEEERAVACSLAQPIIKEGVTSRKVAEFLRGVMSIRETERLSVCMYVS